MSRWRDGSWHVHRWSKRLGGPTGRCATVSPDRRITSDRVRRNTTHVDLLTYLLLAALIGLGWRPYILYRQRYSTAR